MLVDEKILLFNSDCQINRPNQQIFVLFFIAFLIFYSVFDSSKNLLIAKINYLLKDVETNDLQLNPNPFEIYQKSYSRDDKRDSKNEIKINT